MRGAVLKRAMVVAVWGAALSGAARAAELHTGGGGIRRHLEELSVFGRPAGGTFADGVSRVGYSDADLAGREYVKGLMKAAGLAVSVDAAGNIYGRRPGRDPNLPPVLFGSH